MGIYIFTKKESVLKKVFANNVEFNPAGLTKHKPEDGSILYIDVSGLSDANIKTALTQLKKACKGTAQTNTRSSWGVIDAKGSIKDPAALFFDGASDYLGPAFFKISKTINPKRIKTASQWRSAISGSNGKEKAEIKNAKTAMGLPKTGVKLPSASLFPGWKDMQTGKTMPFYLMYCSLQGKTSLSARFGENAFAQIHQRFLAYLFKIFKDGEGLVWMDSGEDCLFLLPPKAKSAEVAIKACIRMLISAPLVTIEALSLVVPANFVFALHYGSLSYSPPSKTGTVVSDAVNFVFHLGAKKAEPGRLTISDEVPDNSIPRELEDCFVSAGEYEGRKIWHTKKFSYVKPWV